MEKCKTHRQITIIIIVVVVIVIIIIIIIIIITAIDDLLHRLAVSPTPLLSHISISNTICVAHSVRIEIFAAEFVAAEAILPIHDGENLVWSVLVNDSVDGAVPGD